MKVSKLQASENRDAILEVAAAQIRERGFGQMNVAEIAKAARLTHGALYSHFGSKEGLQAEAIQRAFENSVAEFAGLTPDQFVDRYLSTEHRDHVGRGCATAALVCEVRLQSAQTRSAFYDGLTRFAALASDSLGADTAEGGQDFAMLAFAAMVGGIAISRSIRDLDEAASDRVLHGVAAQLRQVIATRSAEGRPLAKKRLGNKPRSTTAKRDGRRLKSRGQG